MPVSKQRRSELIGEYTEWLKQSQAVILADYQGIATKDLYQLRSKLHEANGALHVVKNTLMKRALLGTAVESSENARLFQRTPS